MSHMILTKKDIYQGNLILVNAKHPVMPDDYKYFMPIDSNYPDVVLAQKAATVLTHIIKDTCCANSIVPVSGYRSKIEQERIYLDSSKNNGNDFTRKYVAMPNHSEHQTGLAIDLGLKKERIDFIRPDFPYEGICAVFRKTAPKYGFIQRYPKGKEAITGISHEPWHFRYVGYPHSEIMEKYGLTLEEYVDFLRRFPFNQIHLSFQAQNRQIDIYYIYLLSGEQKSIPLPDNAFCEVSGNNVDGCIVTEWR